MDLRTEVIVTGTERWFNLDTFSGARLSFIWGHNRLACYPSVDNAQRDRRAGFASSGNDNHCNFAV